MFTSSDLVKNCIACARATITKYYAGVAPLDDTTDEEVEQDGDDGWMMVKRKQVR